MISTLKALVLVTSALALGAPLTTKAAAAPAGPALWLVADADTQIYLFGTVHMLPNDTQWFVGPVTSAFAKAQELVFEAPQDAQQAVAELTMRLAIMPAGQNWRLTMEEKQRGAYEAALKQMGLPPAAFDRLEPWAVSASLAVIPLTQAGFKVESGADIALNAQAGDKSRLAFETPEQQLAIFDSLPMETQLTWLDTVVKALPQAEAQARELIAHWLAADVAGIARNVRAGMPDPLLYRQLVTDRNANWVAWIAKRLEKPGTVLVAVGAGHLAGTGSVQELLGGRGIEVVRVAE